MFVCVDCWKCLLSSILNTRKIEKIQHWRFSFRGTNEACIWCEYFKGRFPCIWRYLLAFCCRRCRWAASVKSKQKASAWLAKSTDRISIVFTAANETKLVNYRLTAFIKMYVLYVYYFESFFLKDRYLVITLVVVLLIVNSNGYDGFCAVLRLLFGGRHWKKRHFCFLCRFSRE